MKKLIILFALSLFFINVKAQEDKIATDRPSETQTPQLAEQGYLQVETGLFKEGHGADYMLYHPQTFLKYGISKKWELRADVSAAAEKEYSKGEAAYGLLPVQIGFKAALLEERGAVPQTTLYAMAGIPALASASHQVPHLFPQVRLLMENKLSNQWELDYNVGAEWDGEETVPQWVATIEPQVSIGEKWQVFAEAYGKWQQGKSPEHVVDAGLGYFVSKNVKLDVIGGKGLSHEAPDYFLSTGISFRFK